MRVAGLLALGLAACWSTPAPRSTPPQQPGQPSGGAPSITPKTYATQTTGPAVVAAGKAIVDPEHARVAVHRANGIDILDLASGKNIGRVELGWTAEMWPAGDRLIAFKASGQLVDAVLIDHLKGARVAECTANARGPAGSQILRVDVFTSKGTTYLKWETAPPPRMHGGAAMNNAEIAQEMADFRAAYACGLFAVHANGSTCTLDVARWQDADLESCETRQMPPNRFMPSTFGAFTLQLDHQSSGNAGTLVETDTLVVSGKGAQWQTQVDERVTLPPAP